MRKKIEKEIEKMINDRIEWAQTIRLYYGTHQYYHEVNFHDLIHAILDHCKIEIEPQYQKLIVKKHKDSRDV